MFKHLMCQHILIIFSGNFTKKNKLETYDSEMINYQYGI